MAWKYYRRFGAMLVVTFLLPVVVLPIATVAHSIGLPQEYFRYAFDFTMVATASSFVIGAAGRGLWLCPQCRKFFFNGLWVEHFRTECRHCGQQKFSEPDTPASGNDADSSATPTTQGQC